MALLKGSNLSPDQAATAGISDENFNGMSAEERREIERGMIILKLRRYWRLFCVGWFAVLSVYWFVISLINGEGLLSALGIIAANGIGILIWYAIFTYLFLYILADKSLKFYFFVRDLLTKKDTTL